MATALRTALKSKVRRATFFCFLFPHVTTNFANDAAWCDSLMSMRQRFALAKILKFMKCINI